MNDLVVTPPVCGSLLVFNPAISQAKIAVSEAKIKFFRSKKLVPELEASIEGLITEQALFVAWWDANIRSAGGNPSINADRRLLTVTKAEDMTGVPQQTVSRWRKRLDKPEKYRRDLLGALALIAEANHRAEGTGDNQWFTPADYIELARAALGEIDLDPASHPIAQEWIQATEYFTEEHNALARDWHGRVWLNPPYARGLIDAFACKMIDELKAGRVTDAIMLTHNYTDTSWFQLLAQQATAICFVRGRIKFIDDAGEPCNPTQGQAFFYFGTKPVPFIDHFEKTGFVVVPIKRT